MQTTKFIRRSFEVDAVRVTDENIDDVAKWCQGEVLETNGKKYIKVKVQKIISDRQTQAFVGDWVLYAGAGYKVYTNRAFRNSFDQVTREEATQELRTVTADHQGVRVG